MSGDDSDQTIAATISEAEFAKWVTPARALGMLTSGTSMNWHTSLSTLTRYLFHGELLARAAKVKIISRDETRDFLRGRIPSDVWESHQPSSGSDFWSSGLFDWSDGTSYNPTEYAAFDVRFDPDTIDLMAGKATPLPGGSGATQDTGANAARLKDISKDDAERFSRAVLAGWPTATETFAHSKALAFFPENKVPREWFLNVFRLIRGHRNRGKPAKNRE